jgi:hypothetical protein
MAFQRWTIEQSPFADDYGQLHTSLHFEPATNATSISHVPSTEA